MAEVRPARNGSLCKSVSAFSAECPKLLTGALDGDELFGPGDADRNGSGDLLALDPAEGGSLRKFARAAIGGRDRGSAACSRRQASVDAIPVRIVGNDEDPFLSLRRNIGVENGGKGESGDNEAHGSLAGGWRAPAGADSKI